MINFGWKEYVLNSLFLCQVGCYCVVAAIVSVQLHVLLFSNDVD